MKKKKIKNPLIKRIPKELAGEWKKYLVVGLFLILMIGAVSGMYVANESMMTSIEKGKTTYKLENGHFELNEKADADVIKAIEDGKTDDVDKFYPDDDDVQSVTASIYENFYRNEDEDYNNDDVVDGTIRIFAKTEEINEASINEGRLPENENEIAIDRMHADNVGVKVGDTISVSGEKFEIVGLIAYVNYATLHEKSTDMMFDALKFDVAMVTQEGFDRCHKSIHYTYAWKYDKAPADDIEEKQLSDDFLKIVFTQAVMNGYSVEEYLPAYANSAIHFATDDMGSDESMGGVLLDILIVIIAFIFAITISNTMVKESQAIGTLRAMGYTRGELTRHYLAMPVIVTVIAALIGNLLGYTVFKNVVVSMYYNSYSLPNYETVWNATAFVKTTVVPLILMFVINLIVIIRMLHHTPLQFLRHDLKKKQRKKTIRLPKWSFFARFRMRIMFQNVANYIVLFVGILFIMVMLAMAVGMPSTLDYYKQKAPEMMIAKYQYVLKSYKDVNGDVIKTDIKDAEVFSMKSLLRKSDALDEEISVYGIADDSQYIQIDDLKSLKEDEIYISAPLSEKYDYAVGDTITLDEKYEHKQYDLKIAGIYDDCASLAVFMPVDNYRTLFDLDEEAFTGYLSDTEITDIDEELISTVITVRDITKMSDQLDHSMGSYMTYFQVVCILLSAVMIYLLTKIIIEKNENAISMTKILGYTNGEIARLYLVSTTIIVIIADAISVILGTLIMKFAWKMMLATFSGWFAFEMQPIGYVKMFVFVLIGYMIVMFFDFRRIRKVPMDQALKNVE